MRLQLAISLLLTTILQESTSKHTYLQFFLENDIVTAKCSPLAAQPYIFSFAIDIQDIHKSVPEQAQEVDAVPEEKSTIRKASILSPRELGQLIQQKFQLSLDRNSVNTDYLIAVAESEVEFANLSEVSDAKSLIWTKMLPRNDITFDEQSNELIGNAYNTTPIRCSLGEAHTHHDGVKRLTKLIGVNSILVTDKVATCEQFKDFGTDFKQQDIIMILDENMTPEQLSESKDVIMGEVKTRDAFISIDTDASPEYTPWWLIYEPTIIYSETFTAVKFLLTPKQKVTIKLRIPSQEEEIEGNVIRHEFKDQLCIMNTDEFFAQDEPVSVTFAEFVDGLQMELLRAESISDSEEDEEDAVPVAKKQKVAEQVAEKQKFDKKEDWEKIVIHPVLPAEQNRLILNFVSQ